MPEKTLGFLQHLLNSVAEQGRSLIGLARGAPRPTQLAQMPLDQLARLLLTSRGEASGVVIAREIMSRYATLDSGARLAFLLTLAGGFSAKPAAIRAAYEAYAADPSDDHHHALTVAVEAPRQDVLRRLNLAPGNTAALVQMRADVLEFLPANAAMKALDRDFEHLFASWFNRGFLVLKRIDWSSPAHILEKITRYEAVHAIRSWQDLRARIEPPDRRCYAFFHPALADEPLIFVEIALVKEIPAAIEPILAEGRTPQSPASATTAVFYSISNCQKGLARISFGNFLIKQVVEELKRELPALSRFVTLSPVPGFRAFVERELANPDSRFITDQDRAIFSEIERSDSDAAEISAMRGASERLLAAYFLVARTANGKIIDPVARFHLGNGARLERLNPLADFSEKGWRESYSAMVNYLYDLEQIEQNHEGFAINSLVAASAEVRQSLQLPATPVTPARRAS